MTLLLRLSELFEKTFDKLKFRLKEDIQPVLIVGKLGSGQEVNEMTEAATVTVTPDGGAGIMKVAAQAAVMVHQSAIVRTISKNSANLSRGNVTGDGTNDKTVTLDSGLGSNGWEWLNTYVVDAAGMPKIQDIPVILEYSTDNTNWYSFAEWIPEPANTIRSLPVFAGHVPKQYIRATWVVPANTDVCHLVGMRYLFIA